MIHNLSLAMSKASQEQLGFTRCGVKVCQNLKQAKLSIIGIPCFSNYTVDSYAKKTKLLSD